MLVDIGEHIKQQYQTEATASSCFAALFPAENTMRTATLIPGLRTRARLWINNSPEATDMPNNQPIKTSSNNNLSAQATNTSGVTLKISASTLLYTIAFVEGGAVMAIELAGAKMIAPFYGTSLYVWASVLAVTLGGLTTGYFLGGWASYRFPPQKLLAFEVTLGALLIALMPIVGLKIMPATMDLGVRSGSLFSSALLLMPPLICMGMVSPTIIQFMNTGLKETGKTAGTVYAISTVGGIVMTLLMGFYLLPEWGIRKSVYLTAVLLAVSVLISWIGNIILPSANSITSKKV